MDDIMIVLIGVNAFFSLKGFKDRYFFNKYCLSIYSVINQKDYKRLITSGFIHVDWTHLIFNMLSLYFFAPKVIDYFGQFMFLLLYFIFLIFSSLAFTFFHRQDINLSAVGASGAVSGVVFSAILLNPDLYIYFLFLPIPIPAYIFAVLYIVYCIFGMKTNMYNIGHSAHLGGALSGIIFTILFKPYVLKNIYVIFIIFIIIALMVFFRRLR